MTSTNVMPNLVLFILNNVSLCFVTLLYVNMVLATLPFGTVFGTAFGTLYPQRKENANASLVSANDRKF